MHCTNWTGCIYGEMTPEQYFPSSQSFLLPSKESWWDKHPKDFLEIEQVEGWDVLGGLYKEIAFIKTGMQDWERKEREKNVL